MAGNDAVTSFFIGRAMAGGDGVDRSAEISAQADARIAQDTAESFAGALSKEKAENDNWRVYANRLNVHLAARKMSEATLLKELRQANITHPLATEEGFSELFDRMLAEQYSELDKAMANKKFSSFEQKSLNEVGKDRAAVK